MRPISILQFLLIIFILLCLPPMLAHAKGDECINERNSNLKNLCLAKEYANVTQCDRITVFDMRSQCISSIRNRQRETQWGFKPTNVLTADTRGDHQYVWQHQ